MNMNKVTKSMVEAYRVQRDGEWATIVVQGWQAPGTGASSKMMEQGEVLIHSSFGSWGHQWGNLGRPLKQFLVDTTMDYFMGKMVPGRLREFDFDSSRALWQRHLVAARRSRSLTADQFLEVWDESCNSNDCGVEMFIHRLGSSRPLELSDHPLWQDLANYVICRDSPAAASFWRQLWPLFVEQLHREAVVTVAVDDECLVVA